MIQVQTVYANCTYIHELPNLLPRRCEMYNLIVSLRSKQNQLCVWVVGRIGCEVKWSGVEGVPA